MIIIHKAGLSYGLLQLSVNQVRRLEFSGKWYALTDAIYNVLMRGEARNPEDVEGPGGLPYVQWYIHRDITEGLLRLILSNNGIEID